jgi:hypothetical protein
MKKLTPYLANGSAKTCWACGNPFIVRNGNAEAILGPDDRFYCHATGCAHDAFASHVVALKRAA